MIKYRHRYCIFIHFIVYNLLESLLGREQNLSWYLLPSQSKMPRSFLLGSSLEFLGLKTSKIIVLPTFET